jgi:hypothetical protein
MAQRLKKLGQSPRLGRCVTRALTMTYVMVESIFDVMALIILGGIQRNVLYNWRRQAEEGAAVDNPKGLNSESNNC